MITVQLKNQTGRIDAPYIALLTIETFALPASVSDGTTVAMLTPEGDTLAIGHASGGQVTLDSNTLQSAGYCHGVAVGESKNAFLVIGETDALQAIIPVLVRANPLDDLAPPAQMAPAYPTTAELQAILKEMTEQASAASKAAESVSKDAQRVDNLVNVELPKAVEEIDDHLDERVRAAEKTIERAAVEASTALSESASSASTALDGKVSAASTALDNKVATASTALDGKVKQAEDAATAADGSAKAADKSRQDAEAAKGNAAESAKNAATSAEQAEQAKNAIGDVGERLDAVEAGVGEKVPYLSKYLTDKYDVLRGNFNMVAIKILTQMHEGFLMRDAYSKAKDRLLIPALNQVVQVDSVGTIRISVIEDNKTTIYSYSGSTLYKTTVSGSGEGLTFLSETITAMPTAVEALSDVVGYKTANGFVVCTKGHILSADLETEVATFYAVKTYREILKNGEEFYFYDGAVKKFATLTLADDGTPLVTHNAYVQTDGTFFPVTKTAFVKCNSNSLYLGTTAEGVGYLYREAAQKDYLLGIAAESVNLININNPILFFIDKIVCLIASETNTTAQRAVDVARGLFADFTPKGSIEYKFERDFKGNVLYSICSYYNNNNPNQPFYLLKKREA